jgi:hypothetical protein
VNGAVRSEAKYNDVHEPAGEVRRAGQCLTEGFEPAHRRTLRAVRIAALLLALAPTAHAESSKLTQALSPEARTQYDAARADYASGDYAGALAKFERAHALTPDPRLLWNMAACERKLLHYTRVLALLDEYTKTGGALLGDEDRKEAERFGTAVRGHVARVTLATTPADAEALVDGERAATSPMLVNEGQHTVRVSMTGYKAAVVSESAAGGTEVTWSVVLEREAEHAPGPARSRTAPLVLAIAGLAVAATGGALVALSAARFGTLENRCAHACDPASWKDWQTIEPVGDVLLVVGGAAFASGLGWWFATPSPRAASVGMRF